VTDPRWTQATEQLVADELRGLVGMQFTDSDADNRAEQILSALADAGLLVEPGGESGPSFGQTPGWWPSEDPLLISDDAVEEATP
jgi:hypothetical protein